MAETTLAVVGLIIPAYDAISKIWYGCREMANCERDMSAYWRELQGLWAHFEILMHYRVSHLKYPPDLADANNNITKAIMEQLENLEQYFTVCRGIIDKAFPSSAPTRAPTHSPYLFSKKPKVDNTGMATISSLLTQQHTVLSQTGSICRRLLPSTHSQDTDQRYLNLSKQNNMFRSSSSDPTMPHSVHHHSKTLNHWMWAHHDKQDMREAIDSIHRTVSLLRDILTLRDLKEPQKLIPEAETAASSGKGTSMRTLYMNVHQALREANKRSRRSVMFGISALSNLEDNWRSLDNETKLTLRRGSAAIWLQMHVSADESTFLMAEVRLPEASTTCDSIDLPLIESLDMLTQVAPVQNAEEHYELGSLSNKFDPTDKIHVFAQKNPWRKQRTLRDILAAEDLRSRLSRADIVELCLTIVVAHQNMSEVRTVTRNPKLESYVFYQTSPNTSPAAQVLDFDVTCPFMLFGFGQPLESDSIMGATRSPFKHTDTSIVELGLVLVQLAGQTLIPCFSSQSPMIDAGAKSLVDKALGDIETRFGDGLSSTIYACLRGNCKIEPELVQKAIDLLVQLKKIFMEAR